MVTTKEFKMFKRIIALSAVRLESGEIDVTKHIANMYVILGDETFSETKKIIEERNENN